MLSDSLSLEPFVITSYEASTAGRGTDGAACSVEALLFAPLVLPGGGGCCVTALSPLVVFVL